MTVRTITLAEAAWPQSGLLREILVVVGAAASTALAAQIAIPLPWTPVPLTGQSFAVLLSGAVLGARRAFLAQILYLASGAAGLPVFAGGALGVAKLIGPTGGYLLAFPLAAATTGWLAERGWDRRVATTFLALLLGSLVVFVSGLAVLSLYVPRERLLAMGLIPFIPGDLIKSALAALAFPATWRWVNRRGSRTE